MKTPASFGGTTGVLNVGMTIITIMYVGMGFFGYVKYGENSAGSVTLNLPNADMWVLIFLNSYSLLLDICSFKFFDKNIMLQITEIKNIGYRLKNKSW